MVRTILAGLDGSADSQSVLTLGIRWARRFDALLVGIAIIDEPGIHGPEEWVLGETRFMHQLNRKLLHEAIRRAEQVLEAVAIRCAEEGVAFKPLENEEQR
jgi:hypothetical protein